jgi:DNA-binding SARP family transcriptional activator
MPSYEIGLLGRFAVRVDGRPVPPDAWRHKRAAELVKVLALADRHRLHCEQVTDLLWPDLAPDAAAVNLRKAVHFARASLGAAPAIARRGVMLELCPGGQVFVDALAFEAAARAGQVSALDLYQGELLPEDRYAAWAEEPRERLRGLYLRLLKTAELWERVLDVDPADEEAHQALMRRAIGAGDRRAAIRQFERLREHLRADLGVGPDQDSVSLCPPCSMGFRVAAAIAYARAGRLDQARRRLQAAEPIAGMWPGGAWHAAIWEARGVLRQAEGDTERAAALYHEAADRFAELGRPLDRDRCRAAARQAADAMGDIRH